jgi:glycosyltransferase involved in cell wall biosynthesis
MKTPIKIDDKLRSQLAQSSLAICGLAKNCARTLPENINFIEEISSLFNMVKVVVVENGSTDSTRVQLNSWANKNQTVKIVNGELAAFSTDKLSPGVNFYYSRHRIAKLAHLRNQYLEELKLSGISFDYLLVMDFDVDMISFAGVLDSFAQQNSWDAVAAFGYSVSPRLRRRYHDTFALVFLENAYLPQTENSIKKIQRDWVPDMTSNNLLPVFSAFGGLSIYRWNLVNSFQYEVVLNEDSRVEVRCEHYSFSSQLQATAGIRVVLNPLMHLRYERFIDTVARAIKSLIN